MNENIHRVKQDLEIISSVVGFGQPPLGREDIWAFRILGIFGFAWTALAWMAGGLPFHWFSVFALAVSLVGIIAYHFLYTRSKDRTVIRDRVYKGSWQLAVTLGLLVGGFFIWAKFFGELKGATFIGATSLFSGALLVILAITDRWRLFFWGWAIPLLLFGASVQLMPEHVLVALLGTVIGAGGIASGEILSRQLKPAKA